MPTRPKYIAACDFRAAGQKFSTGDPVEHPIVLDAVLRFGDRFVTTTSRRSKAKTTEAEPPAEADTTPTQEATS